MCFRNKYWFLFILLLVLITACSNYDWDVPNDGKPRGTLVSTNNGKEITKNEVIDFVSEFSAKDIAVYNVSYYVIHYRTIFQGKAIDASGILFLPKNVNSAKLIAYFHGTQIPLRMGIFEREIPSNYNGGAKDYKEARNMGLSWASAGYAVFMPDYIGYGITAKQEHPYVYYPEMFESNIDGILAAREFMSQKGYEHDKRLFLTGWSQGGGACLSAHKYIQEQYSDKFTVVASSGLSGPYNFTGFLEDVFERRSEHIKISKIASWGVYALNKFSDMKRPTDQIWSYPVYDQMSAIGTPSNIPDEFLNNYFLSKIINSQDVKFREVCKNNSFSDGWTPVGKVFLHHGDKDEIVPYFNSFDAYNGLTQSGGDVKLYTYPGGEHDTELSNYILNTLNDFNLLQ